MSERQIFAIILGLACIYSGGCGNKGFTRKNAVQDKQAILSEYEPRGIEFVGLSEIEPAAGEQGARLHLFVNVLDQFGSACKYPGTMRFELYEYMIRNPITKGKQVEIWAETDLRHSAENNSFYRDYLRAYEFELDVKSRLEPDKTYVIMATFELVSGKRLFCETHLKLAHL